LVKIIGLKYKKKYKTDEDMRSLRYGKVMVMTDQDQDGSHIKVLVINFFHHNWPTLLNRNFLEEIITPIVKVCICRPVLTTILTPLARQVTKGNNKISFYSLPEFKEWKEKTENFATWKVKYYKGESLASCRVLS